MATSYNNLERDPNTGEWIDTSRGADPRYHRRYSPTSRNPEVMKAEAQYQAAQVEAMRGMPSAMQAYQMSTDAAERERQAQEQANRSILANHMEQRLRQNLQRREEIVREVESTIPVNEITGTRDPEEVQARLENHAEYNLVNSNISGIQGWMGQRDNATMFSFAPPENRNVDPDAEEAGLLAENGLNIPGVESQTAQVPSERVVGIFNSQGDGLDNLTLVPEQQAREEYARLTGELEGATREEREANARERGTYDRIMQLNRGIRDLETRVAEQRVQQPSAGFTPSEFGYQGDRIVDGKPVPGREGDGRTAERFAAERRFTQNPDGTYRPGFSLGGVAPLGVMQQLEQNAAGMQPRVPHHEGPASGTYQAPDGSFVGIGANGDSNIYQGGFATEEEARAWSLANLQPQPDLQQPPAQVVQTGGAAVQGTVDATNPPPPQTAAERFQQGGLFGVTTGAFGDNLERGGVDAQQGGTRALPVPDNRGWAGLLFGQGRVEVPAPPSPAPAPPDGWQRAPEGSGVTAQRPPDFNLAPPPSATFRNLPQVDLGNFLQNQQGNQAQVSPPNPRNDPNFNRSSLFLEGSPLLSAPRVAQRPDPFQSGRAIAGTSSR